MVLARFQATIQDNEGNIVPSATVEVRNEQTNALATIFSDRDGTAPLTNPFTATPEGLAAFHAVGGAYRITASDGTTTVDWRYVGVGTASEKDAETIANNVIVGYIDGFEINPVSANVVSVADGRVEFNSALLTVTGVANNDITTTGADGLDAGSVAADTWYRLYLIRNTTTNAFATVFSTSATPAVPAGFELIKRIGWRLTDGSAVLRNIYQNKDINTITGFNLEFSVTNGSGIVTTPNLTLSFVPPDGSATLAYGMLRRTTGSGFVIFSVLPNETVETGVDAIVRGSAVSTSTGQFGMPMQVPLLGSNLVKLTSDAAGTYQFLASGWKGR